MTLKKISITRKFKILFVLFFMHIIPVIAQTVISGVINTSLTIPKVERNFIGFNSGEGNLESIYNLNGQTTGLDVNPNFYAAFSKVSNRIYWRFPGGTTSNYYNRWASGYGNSGKVLTIGENSSFVNVSSTLQNAIYNKYYNYSNPSYPNAKSNIIFPFINSITKNKTATNNAVFCLNLTNHYRYIPSTTSIPFLNTRTETLKDTAKIKAIINLTGNYLDAFNKSTLSDGFKKIVRQNIDAFLTLVNNNVSVYKVECGNEIFSFAFYDNFLVDYNAFIANTGQFSLVLPSDTKVWLRDDGSAQSIKDSYASLWSYAHLVKLYKVLMTDTLQKLSAAQPGNATYSNHLKNMKFGVPVTPNLNSGFKTWDEFMRQPAVKSYMGIDAYVMHPYFDSTNYFKGYNFTAAANSSVTDLTKEFNNFRDTLEIAYNNRFFKKNHINMINALPAGTEIWYTEWNINFDFSKLQKIGNTMLHSMFYYDAMMNFFDINANKNLQVSCNKINPIKMCNYHISYTKSMTDYPFMRFSGGYSSVASDPQTTTNSTANAIEYNATYYTNVLLSPIVNDDSMVYLNNINGGFNTVANCSFRTFYKKDCTSGCCKDNVYIYFNNKSGNAYKIDVNKALNVTNTACIKATKNYLYANTLYASMGRTTFNTDDIIHTTDGSIQRVNNEQISTANLTQVVIPKYALGYIKAVITVPSATCACNSALRTADTTTSAVGEKIITDDVIEEKNFAFINVAPRIYPNPNTNGQLSIDIFSQKETESQIRIFDIAGNLMRTFTKQLSEGENLFQVDVSDMAKSIYILRMDGDGINFTNKLVVQ
ncbi:MAG: fibronectin type domain protein [Bacteroidota bacterium]|nr:fibronectin type domain protein [Bacteroidota bacterium]